MSDLASRQQALTDFIRNPAVHAGPADIEKRRLNIYGDLFYKNIEGFLANGFPVLRTIISDTHWHSMVRDFIANHQCQSPLFLEITQEFLRYLSEERQPQPWQPGFMLELAHYEWVELALDVNEAEFPVCEMPTSAEALLTALPVVSPLAWSLVYHYPVHQIGPGFQPEAPPQEPTYLLVYRNRDYEVKFMESNAVTARTLELLQQEGAQSGRQVLTQVAAELQHPDPQQVIASGQALLENLLAMEVLAGIQS